jgi:hypothetical protein
MKKLPHHRLGLFAPYVIILVSFVLIFASLATCNGPSGSVGASGGSKPEPADLYLRVDARRHARVFSGGLKTIGDVAGFFEFFERSLDGSRRRIASGPWDGSLEEGATGSRILNWNDRASGAESEIIFTQTDTDVIEVTMKFRAPSRPANIGFDIMKVSADLFQGAWFSSSPPGPDDADSIPGKALSADRPTLLKGKNRVLMKGVFRDLEIRDLMQSRSIRVIDARAIPWDREKGITFCGGRDNLAPGSIHTFCYSIRCLKPSISPEAEGMKLSGAPVRVPDAWALFALPPKVERRVPGHYLLGPQDGIYGTPNGSVEKVLAREIEKRTGLRLLVNDAGHDAVGKGIRIERTAGENSSGLPPEGFEIVTAQNGIRIRGADDRACLYGAYTLVSRLQAIADGWMSECGTVRDWPDFPVRGVCIELLKPTIRDPALVKRYLDSFSRARSNIVIFLHTPQQVRSWAKNADDGGWSRKQMEEIARYARSLQIDVWGGMGSSFGVADFSELDIDDRTNLYNPFRDSSYRSLFSLYEVLLDTYGPSTFLIGHDEIRGLTVYSGKYGRSTAEILSGDIRRIRDWLHGHGVRTAMWGDMLLDYETWGKAGGSANSRNPSFNSGATHLAIGALPSDILILDWHYNYAPEYGSIGFFRRNGFEVAGVPWHDPRVAKTFARSVGKFGGRGVIATDWGFLSTLSPAATTLYAPLCAWSVMCPDDNGSNLDVATLAEIVRGRNDAINIRKYEQYPVRLETSNGASTTDPFGLGPILDLRALPAGRQIFAGTTFDLVHDKGGVGIGCVVVGVEGGKFPREAAIFQGLIQAEWLAFLHTVLVEEPQYRPRRLGSYQIDYENGSSIVVELMEGWNITDIRAREGVRRNDWTFARSPDVLIGARTGWHGESSLGVPLNLQVFTWQNPHPELKIRRIRLNADNAPPNSRIALLGLTRMH